LALVAMALPGMSGLEALRRLAGVALQQPPAVLAVGARDDVRLRVVATHEFAHAIQELPCPDGMLLRRLWLLADREVERDWARLPPLPKAVVRSTCMLLGQAGTAVTSGGELASDQVRAAGKQLVEAAVRPADGRRAGRIHGPPSRRKGDRGVFGDRGRVQPSIRPRVAARHPGRGP
jgi:hypothetical protein